MFENSLTSSCYILYEAPMRKWKEGVTVWSSSHDRVGRPAHFAKTTLKDYFIQNQKAYYFENRYTSMET